MRKADLKKNHKEFDRAVSRYRRFMEKVLDAKRVIGTRTEKRDLAESIILRVCAWWEYFIDEHLVDCVNVDSSKLKEFFGVDIPGRPSKALCQALIFGDGFRDFRSFGDLKGFSKRILPEESNPFLAVDPPHANKIDEVYKIRNYLSHYSHKAQRSLHSTYKEKYGMKNFLEPGQFLLTSRGARLWDYFKAFEGASQNMKDWC